MVTIMQTFLFDLHRTIMKYIDNNEIDVDNIENSSIPDYWLHWTLKDIYNASLNIINTNKLFDKLHDVCQNKINNLLDK